MKFFNFFFVAFCAALVAANWSKEDYEIFSLNDRIKKDLGENTDFYSWLELPKGPKSSLEEITKAYRKLSRKIHPDKFSGKSKKLKKKAEERFQRLSLVGNILRSNELRRRYDYFYSKGFPKWKGTGYYYSRFRPGIVMTLLFLFFLISGFHFIALKISRKQDFKRIVTMKEEVKAQAWNNSPIPPADGSDRKVEAPNGVSFHVSNTGEVSIIESENGSRVLIPVDENEINLNPGFKESLIFKLPAKLWNVSLGKLSGKYVNTTVTFSNSTAEKEKLRPQSEEKPTKKRKTRGERLELPNGKVIYSKRKK
ncbi:hypothetical protein ACI3LY_002005 [Candidozyma auris]|uniref:J domain-containing protein n=2 Tax=Candidozyma auris TaxID=498019 RepID=A0A2H0ZKE0_CANAR|nr:hypothetical protein QG37_03968 [[Candida] auris]PIS51124.1 hypothetical protein B9J08_002696 [[Candida] auris]QWW22434.1 hypothetical protein CA7LBN_001180 [[Candida] auris]